MSTRLSRLTLSLAVAMLALTLFTLPAAYALSSGEKSPEEEKAEKGKKAVNAYNDGVKEMQTAKGIAQKGDSAYAFNYRATSDAKAKKAFEKAAAHFTEAIELKPDMPEAYNNLGYCYRKLGKLDESLQAYEKAIGLKADFAQAREYRGETYLALGLLEKAQTDKDFLMQMKSPLADTLAKSIELYQLEKINAKAQAH
ncbi:MAG: tetratricopeptide repeat protein [Candidatus Zixiibacteriota bacterium]